MTRPTIKTTDDLPLPPFNILMENPSKVVTDILKKIEIKKIVKRALQGTWKRLFTLETAPTHIKSITIEVKPMDNQSVLYLSGITNETQEVFITLTNENIIEDGHKEHGIDYLRNLIFHHIAIWLIDYRNKDDSYPIGIWRGFADYVAVREGLLSSLHHKTADEVFWYGPKTMPYFLCWLEGQYGEGTVRRLIAAFNAPYDKAIFEKVTGTSISTLWKMYCASIGRKDAEQKDYIGRFEKLWPLPKLSCIIEPDIRRELSAEVSNTITDDMLGGLINAVLMVLTHLYTPKNTPNGCEEFRIVFKSKMESWYSLTQAPDYYEFAFSAESIFSKEIEVKDVIEKMVVLVAFAFQDITLCDNINVNYASWPEGLMRAIAGFVLIKVGLLPPTQAEIPAGYRDHGFSLSLAYFLSGIESGCGDGTIRKLIKYMMSNKCNAPQPLVAALSVGSPWP